MSPVPSRPFDEEKPRELRRRLERRVRRTHIIVVLLGARGRGLAARRRVASDLVRRRFTALVPEDDFPPDISPSLAEEAILSDAETHLVFLNVESWGSATEFGQLRANPRIAPKLRILVPAAFHPIHGTRHGYLSDAYLTHLAVHGHVYAAGTGGRLRVPKMGELVILLAERYRQARALGSK